MTQLFSVELLQQERQKSMTFAITAEPVPLEKNPDGVIRIGGTRVTLDTIVTVFEAGATPEEIVQR